MYVNLHCNFTRNRHLRGGVILLLQPEYFSFYMEGHSGQKCNLIATCIPLDRIRVPMDRTFLPFNRTSIPFDRTFIPLDRTFHPFDRTSIILSLAI